MTKISIISALSDNYVIGNQGDLPWHIPEDFKLFVQITKGKPVVMGRKTWDSLPKKPLPNRVNIVISKNPSAIEGDCVKVSSLEEALNEGKKHGEEIMILGGSTIYKEALDKNLITNMYLSHVKGNYTGDTYFPEFDKDDFKIIEEKDFEKFIFREYGKK